MKTINYALLLLFVLMTCFVHGQDEKSGSEGKDEISVSTDNLNFDNLSLKYAKHVSNDWWLKLGLINLGINSYERNPYKGSFITTETKLNGGLLIGIEKEKELTKKLSLMMGLNAQIAYDHSKYGSQNPAIPESERDTKVYSYSPGIGFGLGFFYHLNNNILLGVEINPTVSYYYEKNKTSVVTNWYQKKGYDFSLNSNSGFLTLKVRF